jgi:hypothetical protein
MPIPYPTDPLSGQTFTYEGVDYTWSGVAWISTYTADPVVDRLEDTYNAMIVLVAKIESLEQQIVNLQSLQEGNNVI